MMTGRQKTQSELGVVLFLEGDARPTRSQFDGLEGVNLSDAKFAFGVGDDVGESELVRAPIPEFCTWLWESGECLCVCCVSAIFELLKFFVVHCDLGSRVEERLVSREVAGSEMSWTSARISRGARGSRLSARGPCLACETATFLSHMRDTAWNRAADTHRAGNQAALNATTLAASVGQMLQNRAASAFVTSSR